MSFFSGVRRGGRNEESPEVYKKVSFQSSGDSSLRSACFAERTPFRMPCMFRGFLRRLFITILFIQLIILLHIRHIPPVGIKPMVMLRIGIYI